MSDSEISCMICLCILQQSMETREVFYCFKPRDSREGRFTETPAVPFSGEHVLHHRHGACPGPLGLHNCNMRLGLVAGVHVISSLP